MFLEIILIIGLEIGLNWLYSFGQLVITSYVKSQQNTYMYMLSDEHNKEENTDDKPW